MLTSVIYHIITLLVLIRLCSPCCWHLDFNYCHTRYRQSQLRFVLSPLLLHLRLLGMFQSDIPLSTLTWPAKHSPNQDKSPHTGYTFTPWVVSFTSPSIAYSVDSSKRISPKMINLLRPSDAIWRHRSWSTLAQVMACCLTASSHYLNQCWLIISNV